MTDWQGFKFGLLILAVVGALAWIIAGTNDAEGFYAEHCARKWKLGGYATRYERHIGCMVEIAPGRFVAEQHVKINAGANP